jgi:hypothetical protein
MKIEITRPGHCRGPFLSTADRQRTSVSTDRAIMLRSDLAKRQKSAGKSTEMSMLSCPDPEEIGRLLEAHAMDDVRAR